MHTHTYQNMAESGCHLIFGTQLIIDLFCYFITVVCTYDTHDTYYLKHCWVGQWSPTFWGGQLGG